MLLIQLGISYQAFLNICKHVNKLIVDSRYQYLTLCENFKIPLFTIILNILLIANDYLIKISNIISKAH